MAHGGDTWSYSRGRVASHTFLATVHALRRPEEDVGAAGVEPRTLAALATFAPEADRREGRIKPWPRRPSVLPLGFRADKAPMSRPARVRVGRRLDVAQGLSAWVGGVATRAETRFRAIWASHLPGVVGSVSSKEVPQARTARLSRVREVVVNFSADLLRTAARTPGELIRTGCGKQAYLAGGDRTSFRETRSGRSTFRLRARMASPGGANTVGHRMPDRYTTGRLAV